MAVWVIVDVVWNGDMVATTGLNMRRLRPIRFFFLRQSIEVSTAAKMPLRTSLILTLMGKKSTEPEMRTVKLTSTGKLEFLLACFRDTEGNIVGLWQFT